MTETLTVFQTRFAYAVAENPDMDGVTCAKSAGYSDAAAGAMATYNLKHPAVQRAILERKEQLAAAAGITPQLVLRELLLLATADPRELVQTKVLACRHCYGIDHLYQWTPGEYAAAVDKAMAKDKPLPELLGGIGYDPRLIPSQDCPECAGYGIERVVIADTSKLSPGAARLYAGAKQTKDGPQILMRSQDGAIAKLMDYLGMANKGSVELSGKGGGPIQTVTDLLVHEMSDEQLLAIASKAHSRIIEGTFGGTSPEIPANTL